MTDIRALMAAVEESPAEWDRWLVLADALDEDGKPQAAYACRWCATREQRPAFRDDVRRYPWCWLRGGRSGGPTNMRLRRDHEYAVLHRVLFDELPDTDPGVWRMNYQTFWSAVLDLGRALNRLRDIVEVRL